jgi:glycosyltransferase involved in cell wall biosynthesis
MVVSPLSGAPNVLFIGRLSKEKDLERLLDAWPAVVGDRPDASLTLAGSGGAYRSVESILKQRVSSDPVLSSSVVLSGWVEDVSALLSANDVFVFPSLSEGMSNALLEAAAAGRVIVASNIPANRAVLGDDYPLLFEAGDTDALGRALRSAITDEKVRASARDRLALRIDSFSERGIVDRVEGMVEGAYRARNQHP